MSDVAKLGLEIETKGADEATRKLNDLDRAAKGAADGADKLNKTADRLDGTLNQLTGTAAQADGVFTKPFLQTAAADIAVRGAAMAVSALTDAVMAGIDAYAQYEVATVQLTRSMERVGNMSGMSLRGIQELAGQLESTTGISEEAILRIAQVINRTGKATGEEFERLIRLSLDLSSAMGGDPVNAAEQLARALRDPERAVGMLRRSFADLDPIIADQVERMAQLGDQAGATKLLLSELEKVVGGDAAAAADTLSMKFANLKDAVLDGGRTMVDASGAGDALKTVVDALADAARRGSDDFESLAYGARNLGAGFLEAGKAAMGYKHNAELARDANSVLSYSFRVLSGDTIGATIAMANLRVERAKAEAAERLQQDRVETMSAGFQRYFRGIQEGVQYTRRLGEQILKNNEALDQERKLLSMSDKEREVAKAGTAAYESAKKSLIAATGRFGDAEKAEAERMKSAAQETARMTQQLEAAARAHGRAGSAASGHAKQIKELEDPMKDLTRDLEEYVTALEREADMARLSDVERDKAVAGYRIEDQILRALGKSNDELARKYRDRAEIAIDSSEKIKQAAEEEQRAIDDANRFQEDSIRLFGDFASSVISGSEDIGQALGNLLIRLLELYAQMQIMQAMGAGGGMGGGGFLGSAFSWLLGTPGGSIDPSALLQFPFSRGGVVDGGDVVPFARGGVVQRPTMRSMALMGEAGPEAVLPLRRDRSGNLGVASEGGDVKVVVQNIDQRKSGAPVETQQSRGQNGEIMIRTYIRDEVRRAINDGAFDKDMSKNFNLGRNPTRRS